MGWNSVIGQDRVKVLLKNALRNGTVAHAYLFFGPAGVGKDALAIEFAKALLCANGTEEACGTCQHCRKVETLQHPDARLIFALPVGKNEKTGDPPITVLTDDQVAEVREQIRRKAEDPYHPIEVPKANFIKINSIRDIKRDASMSSVEQGRKVFILLGADTMNAEAGNSLLKTLEEPLPGTVILLTTSSKDRLLPTIVSRCQSIYCERLPDEVVETALIERNHAEAPAARVAAQLAGGSYAEATRLLEESIQNERDDVVDFVRLIIGKNRLALLDTVDDLVSSGDRAAVGRSLAMLEGWFRDALRMRSGLPPPMAEADRAPLESFLSKFKNADLPGAVVSVERAIAQIDKNVYLTLVLTNLVIDLRKLLMEPTPA